MLFYYHFFFSVTHNPYTYFTSLQSLNSAANYLVSTGFYVILYIIWSCMSGPRCLCLIFHFENIFPIFWVKQTIYSPHVLDFVVLQDAYKTKVHELFSGTLHLRFSCRWTVGLRLGRVLDEVLYRVAHTVPSPEDKTRRKSAGKEISIRLYELIWQGSWYWILIDTLATEEEAWI